MTDLAVVGQDPRYGGGPLSHMEAFVRAAAALGRTPEFFYVAHPSLAHVALDGSALDVPGTRAPVSRVEAARLVLGSRRLAPRLRDARSLWVVAAAAPHGYAAPLSGRPYVCWIGTGLDDELRVQRPRVAPRRRVALALNTRPLLRLERAVLRGAARVYAATASTAAELGAAGASDVAILPIPVDVERFAPAAPTTTPTLVFTGRAHDPRKNVGLLLDAFTRVRARIPDVRLRLVGDTPACPVPDGVDVVGRVSDVAVHLRGATLFVLPSLQEGFGIAAAEALASGVPVVTTPSRGPEELVRASGGGRVLSGWSADELAGTLVELLGDPVTLAEMASRGRDYVVREHSFGRFHELLAHAFEELDA